MNIGLLLRRLLSGKEKEISEKQEFELLDSFSLSQWNIFGSSDPYAKSFSDALNKTKEEIEIEKKESEKVKEILSTKLNQLQGLIAYKISNMPCKDRNTEIDVFLGLKEGIYKENASPYKPLQVLANFNTDSTIYQFCFNVESAVMRIENLTYENGILTFSYKPLLGVEAFNGNEEIGFLSSMGKINFEKGILPALEEEQDIALRRKFQLYPTINLFTKQSYSKILGLIVKDLALSREDEELQEIKQIASNRIKIVETDASKGQKGAVTGFDDFSIYLYEKYAGKISTVILKDGVLIIEGNDRTHPIIYTTLSEQEWTDGMRKLPNIRKPKENTAPGVEHKIAEKDKADGR